MQGGHAKGFNQRSVGVVVLGDFRTDAISTASVTALGDLLGWKLFLHGVDPTAPVRRISADNARFPEGTVVTLDAVAGHGDTGYTACPGDHLLAQLGRIRSRAASIAATSRGSGTFAAHSVSMGIAAVPLRGDFDGDGRGDLFWYGPGSAADEVWYGRADGTFTSMTTSVTGTYTPFAGDFDHDGRSDLFFYAPGSATDSIWYGATAGFRPTPTNVTGTYQPVTGDFDGDLRTDVLWYGAGAAPDSLWLAEPARRWTNKVTSVAGTYAPVVGDFDQDDRSDVLWYGSGSARDGLWLGGSAGFRSRSATVPYVATPLVGDFAGGRGHDVLWYGVGAAADALWVSGVTGGFSPRAVTVVGTYRPVVADVDGGGRDDIIWYGPGGASDSLWRARGDGTFTTSKPTIELDAVGLPLDGDGDGLQDVLWYGAGARTGRLLAEHLVLRRRASVAQQLLDLIQNLVLRSAACRPRPPRRCCAEHGMHVTAQRLAVLRAVSDLPHSTADDIYAAVRAEIGAISRQTVYDALAALTDRGVVPSHPAGRLVGPLREPRRRQPPPPRVPDLRPDGRRRLRGGRHPVPDGRPTTPATRSTRPRSSTGAAAPTCVGDPRPVRRPARHEPTARHNTGEAPPCLKARTQPSTPRRPRQGRPRTNQDWWPNQLDLSVLHQHSPSAATRSTRTSTTPRRSRTSTSRR